MSCLDGLSISGSQKASLGCLTPVLRVSPDALSSPSLAGLPSASLMSCSQLHSESMCCHGSRSLWRHSTAPLRLTLGQRGSGSFRIWKHLGHRLSSSGAPWYQTRCPGAQQTHTALWSTSEGAEEFLLKRNKVWPPGGTESHFRILQGLRNHTGACDTQVGDLNKQRFKALL